MTFVKTPPDDSRFLAHPLFSGIPVEEVARLRASCTVRRFAAAEALFREGDMARQIPFLLEGDVLVLRHDAAGAEKVFGRFGPGEFVALAVAFMPECDFPMTARTLTGGAALMLPRRALFASCRAFPDLALRIAGQFAARLRELVERLDCATSSSAAERLADDLLRLHAEQNLLDLRLPLNRAQWAATLGIRYETLSRLLSAWRRCGAIVATGQRLTILDLAFLRRAASPNRR